MNIIFLRHGEAIDNVNNLISDKEIYWSILTQNGIDVVEKSIESLPLNVDKIYTSPLPRTIETAHYVHTIRPKAEVIIENRICELYHGKYTHQENNEDLDNIRIKQIHGDYFVRLGQYGENNFEVEDRLCNFLMDVYHNNFNDNTVVIVSHGSIISYMKRILKIKTAHIQTGKLEIFNNVNFEPLFGHIEYLKKIKNEKIKARLKLINKTNVSKSLKNNLLKMTKSEFNNIEFSDEVFDEYFKGLNTKKLRQLTSPKFVGNIILVCFYTDFENFADVWINHYLSIGIRNFVLIDNGTTDATNKILAKYINKANISFWSIDDRYNCYKMCGWKQQIFEYYGVGNIFITVDSDELLVYKDYKNLNIDEFVSREKLTCIKALMLDVYTDKNLYAGKIEDFKYVDKGTYKITSNVSYGQRFFGGPRSRVFGINPSLQKIPLMKYTGKELFVNDHFYYPWNLNNKAKFCAYLLHYKFLPGDDQKYIRYAKDGRHWNDSREYKIYSNNIASENKLSFYDNDISILVDDLDFEF